MLACEEYGVGYPLVLLHAFPFSGSMWRETARSFAGSGFRVIVPDLPGFGKSTQYEEVTTMAKCAQECIRLLDSLGPEKACFAGISMGGYVMLELVRKYRDRISALVFCDTACVPDTEARRAGRARLSDDIADQGPAALVEQILPVLLSGRTKREKPDLLARLRTEILLCRPGAASAALRGMAEREDGCGLLGRIDVPVHLIFGEQDAVTTPRAGRDMQKLLQGSTMDVIPDAGHLSNLEQPELFQTSLMSFLNTTELSH